MGNLQPLVCLACVTSYRHFLGGADHPFKNPCTSSNPHSANDFQISLCKLSVQATGKSDLSILQQSTEQKGREEGGRKCRRKNMGFAHFWCCPPQALALPTARMGPPTHYLQENIQGHMILHPALQGVGIDHLGFLPTL